MAQTFAQQCAFTIAAPSSLFAGSVAVDSSSLRPAAVRSERSSIAQFAFRKNVFHTLVQQSTQNGKRASSFSVRAMAETFQDQATSTAASTKLYVGNLAWSCDDEMLNQAFSQFGEVKAAEVVLDRESGRSRGFAFVTMASPDAAEKARRGLDGTELAGRAIRVNFPQPKGERAPRAERGERSERSERSERTYTPRGDGEAGDANRLYVGNLPWSMDDGMLEDLFMEFGTVNYARVVMDRDSGRSRGFAFVALSTPEEANEAMANLDGEEIGGRTIRVNLATKSSGNREGRERRAPREQW
uniref:Chloroplast single strand DNA binding protein n=1 Tax=Mesostigma viride TaxID=41882 RepID=A3QQP3_MESVI|nr:chloroplast single strand DNA binding protein [Mesostigma viride]|eukprot:jgi/Mesvir1/27934/Mv25124-RA.1